MNIVCEIDYMLVQIYVVSYGMYTIYTVTYVTSININILLSISAHNSNQICFRVVPPEEGQVMPETYRDFEP
jgi:hypothetical protein